MVVPLGAIYTPLKHIEQMPVLPYDPIACKGNNCGAILSPYARVDYNSKLWVCPFCFQRNHFPPHYADISENNLPAELIPQFTTIEYALPRAPAGPPIFLWVIDTCMREDELQSLKDALEQSLQLLSSTAPNALLGLITFGTVVHLHELGYEHCGKSFTFKGTKDLSPQQLGELLGLPSAGSRGRPQPQMHQANGASARFLLPISEAEFAISNVLSELRTDPWPVPSDARPQRATGVAVSIAASLLEVAFPNTGARAMLFVGGPCTIGPGQTVGIPLSEAIRSHNDVEKDSASCKYMKKAIKHYQAVAKRVSAAGHVFDIFACALDQCGFAEMRSLVERTGGYAVMSETFTVHAFRQSLSTVFSKDPSGTALKMAFGGALEVFTSQDVKVCGAIGNCNSMHKKGPNVSETEIGLGGTNAWSMGGMDENTTMAVYFEVASTGGNANAQQASGNRYVQMRTSYQHSSGQYRLRVTTRAHALAEGGSASLVELARGFDQEAAAVLMARIAAHKTATEDAFDILRWIDRMLIRLVSKFADYRKDEPASFRLGSAFSLYPQFMFHLRRSQFLQVFGNSPDETMFYRCIFAREDTTNSLIMIQPTLLAYSFDGPPVPVLLDVTSIQPDRILLLDTFFHVIVFHGETISAWRKQGFQDNPDHQNFRELLAAPKEDGAMLLQERFPVPVYVECDHYGSQARFLLSKLNPSVTHNSAQNDSQSSDFLFTDDVSFAVFMEHLKRLAVESN